jgi:hypothetical protein
MIFNRYRFRSPLAFAGTGAFMAGVRIWAWLNHYSDGFDDEFLERGDE